RRPNPIKGHENRPPTKRDRRITDIATDHTIIPSAFQLPEHRTIRQHQYAFSACQIFFVRSVSKEARYCESRRPKTRRKVRYCREEHESCRERSQPYRYGAVG